MWIFTPYGFYSVVHKPWNPDGVLTIRARDKADLESLWSSLKMAGEITEDAGADYRFRFEVHSADLAALMAEKIQRIDYDNFKNKVSEVMPGREITYGRVWTVLRDLQLPPEMPDVALAGFPPPKGREEDESGLGGLSAAQIGQSINNQREAFEDTAEELEFREAARVWMDDSATFSCHSCGRSISSPAEPAIVDCPDCGQAHSIVEREEESLSDEEWEGINETLAEREPYKGVCPAGHNLPDEPCNEGGPGHIWCTDCKRWYDIDEIKEEDVL